MTVEIYEQSTKILQRIAQLKKQKEGVFGARKHIVIYDGNGGSSFIDESILGNNKAVQRMIGEVVQNYQTEIDNLQNEFDKL